MGRLFEKAEAVSMQAAANERQIEEVIKALGEADRGDYATEEDVNPTVEKWTQLAR